MQNHRKEFIGIIYLAGMGCLLAQNYQEHTPRTAFDFIDSVGINTHIDAKTTSYNDLDLVIKSLKATGIHYVREDPFEGGTPFQVSRFQTLVNAGVKVDINMGYGDAIDLVPVMLKAANELEQVAPGSICSLEGYNEVDGTNAKAHCLTYDGESLSVQDHMYDVAAKTQKHLFEMVQADPILKKLPIVPFSIAWYSRTIYVPDVSAFTDYKNVHAYAVNGGPPRRPLSTQVEGTLQVAGKPIVMTETGYPTLYPGSPTLKNLVDEQVQSRFLLDTLFDNFSDDVVKTYIYELLDRRANPGDTTDQAHYGIFRYDGTPKPAAPAIASLLKIIDDGATTPAGNTSLTPLSYSVVSNITDQNGNDDSHNTHAKNYDLLLEKKSGVYDIVIWSEPFIWDPATFTMIPRKGTDTATVQFPKALRAVNVYDPTSGVTPIGSQMNINQVSVTITDHPIIIEVTP